MVEKIAAEETPWRDLSSVVVATTGDGIVVVDDHGTILLCNAAAQRLLDRPAAQLVETPFGYPLAEGVTDIELILPGGHSQVVEMRVTSATWENKRLHVAALRDMTRHRQLEADRQAALERQNIVVGVAAHEMRNPLAAIAVLTDILRDQNAALSQKQRAATIDRIAERTHYLQALISKLLTTARIDSAGPGSIPERVPVLEILLERLIDVEIDHLGIHLSCNPDLTALADRGELAEMLTNYLENALSHGQPPIEIRAELHSNHIEVRVTDSGPGVPETFVPELFDRFTRGPAVLRDEDGTGLGLWIVRRLAQANGGEAWYEPGDDGGACFCLQLRRAPTPGSASGTR
jgi:signal transduction histidine kinase